MSPPPHPRQSGLVLVQAPYGIERARARQEEEHRQDASLGMPAEQTAEVIKDIDRKGEGEAVKVRPPFNAASTAMTATATSMAIERVRSITTKAPFRSASAW